MRETIFHPDGSTEVIEDGFNFKLSPSELFNSLGPEQADAVITLAIGLVMKAGPLWDALVDMPNDEPSRPSLEIVTDAVLTAGLCLLEE